MQISDNVHCGLSTTHFSTPVASLVFYVANSEIVVIFLVWNLVVNIVGIQNFEPNFMHCYNPYYFHN